MNRILADEPIVELSPDEVPLTEVGILIVDDDPAFRFGLKTFLREFVGFDKVFTAGNGREAIEIIEREESVELITLDYEMPEMDGLELLAYLEADSPRSFAVTMITGVSSEELKEEFASRSSSKLLTNHFLVKPIDFEKLEPVILEAYEDLKASHRPAETGSGGFGRTVLGDPGMPDGGTSRHELLARFDSLEASLDENTRALRELTKGRMWEYFWFDLLKILFVAFLLFTAWHLGLAEKLQNQLGASPDTVDPRPLPQGPGEPQPIIEMPIGEAIAFQGKVLDREPSGRQLSPVVLDSEQAAAHKQKKRSEPLPLRERVE